jgi:hypothetical protein
VKRWYNWTVPRLAGGTVTLGFCASFTLSYGVAPGALADGMSHLVQFHAPNDANATLNVNGLGALPLQIFLGGAWIAAPEGLFTAGQLVRVAYNQAAGTYRVIGAPFMPGWTPWATMNLAGLSAASFTGIPAGANHLELLLEGGSASNGITVGLQLAGASGTFGTGASTYSYAGMQAASAAPSLSPFGSNAATSIAASGAIATGNLGYQLRARIHNIQSGDRAKVDFEASHTDGVNLLSLKGVGVRNAADTVTGIRASLSAGIFSGGYASLMIGV